MFVYRNIAPEIVDCRNKTNKSTLLKTYLEQILLYFQKYHEGKQVNIYKYYICSFYLILLRNLVLGTCIFLFSLYFMEK